MATTLQAGDIAIIGVNADNPDAFSFVTLVDLESGTEIFFTDNGVFSDGTFRENEGIVKYTAPSAIAAGTVIAFTGIPGDFTEEDAGFALATSGDQVIAYQGAAANPTFIYAAQTNSTQFQSTASNSNDSALPPGLVVGQSAVAVGAGADAEFDNSTYDGSVTSGAQAELLAAISNAANWNGSNSRITNLADGPFTVTDGGSGPGATLAINTPYSFDFETPLAGAGWQAVSVDSDTGSTWSDETFGGDSFAEVNGFGDSAAANDWLISPLIDISGLSSPVVSFGNTKNFEDNGLSDPEVTFLVSSDYSGSGDPTTANWTPLSYSFSTGGFSEVSSGEIGLAGLGASQVYFAFQYQSSGTGGGASSLWQIDDFFVGEAQVVDPAPLRSISEIQGVGFESPLDEETVTTRGIVTKVLSNGFFIQTPDGEDDGDAATSEGLWVFTGSSPTVALGQDVSVSGEVGEFFGLTQISADSIIVESTENDLPMAVQITLPGLQQADLEAYEGMRFELVSSGVDPLVIIENFNLDRFGETTVAEGNQTQPTQLFDPDTQQAEIQALISSNTNERLLLDDGNGSQNPDEFPYLPATVGDNGNRFLDAGDTFSADGPTVRLGAEVSDVQGVLSFGFSEYRLLVDDTLTIDPATNEGAREAEAPAVGGDLTVASFNVLNYFTSIDLPGVGTGPDGLLNPRGADTQSELERQTDKLVGALFELDADIVGLQEIENDGGDAISTLVAELNAVYSDSNPYAFVDPKEIDGVPDGFIGADAITTGFIYKPDSVSVTFSDVLVFEEASAATTFAAADVLNQFASVDDQVGDFQRNRPALAATFEDKDSGEVFTVAVNHFKSKGDSNLEDVVSDAQSAGAPQAAIDALLADPNYDQGDGQGFWNQVRTDAATELASWLTDTSPDGYAGGQADTENLIVIGDLNAYRQEDPLDALRDVFVDLLPPDAYSFVFDGQRGALDHALVSEPLNEQITGVAEWRINADEPDLLNYDESFNNPSFYDDNLFGSSDHDPLIIGLDLAPSVNQPSVLSGVQTASVQEQGDKADTNRADASKPFGDVGANLSITDPDSDGWTELTFSIDVPGAESLLANEGLNIRSADGALSSVRAKLDASTYTGEGTPTFTITAASGQAFTEADIQAVVSNLRYQVTDSVPNEALPGRELTISLLDDGTDAGLDGVASAPFVVSYTLAGANDAPGFTRTGSDDTSTAQNTPIDNLFLALDPAPGGNKPIVIREGDDDTNVQGGTKGSITISVENGVLQFVSAGALSLSLASGGGTNQLVLEGPINDFEDLLSGLGGSIISYTPNAGFSGTDTVSYHVSDQGDLGFAAETSQTLSYNIEVEKLVANSHIEFDTTKLKTLEGRKPNFVQVELHSDALDGGDTLGYSNNGTKAVDDDELGETLVASELIERRKLAADDAQLEMNDLASGTQDIGGFKTDEADQLNPVLTDLLSFEAFKYKTEAETTPDSFVFRGDTTNALDTQTGEIAMQAGQGVRVQSKGFGLEFGVDRNGKNKKLGFDGDGGDNKAIDANEALFFSFEGDLQGVGLSFAVDRIGNDNMAVVDVDFYAFDSDSFVYAKVDSRTVSFAESGDATGADHALANLDTSFDAVLFSSADGDQFRLEQLEFNTYADDPLNFV